MRPGHLASIIALSLSVLSISGTQAETTRELLNDAGFSRGLRLLAPTGGKREPQAELKPDPTGAAPIWEVAQWSSRFPALDRADHTTRWSNAAKTIGISSSENSHGTLTLELNGSVEYGNRARSASDPWVHLLVEQAITESPSIAALQALKLKLSWRVNHCRQNAEVQYDPSIHAAQLVLFLHVSNTDRSSPQFGRYLHFGVPLFDNRHRVPPAHIAPDTGGTGMHIYMPSLKDFTPDASDVGNWHTIDKDILPLIRRGLDDAFAKGHFGDSRDPAAYQITFFTVGWELPGNFDVSSDLRDLSLQAVIP